MWTSSLALLVSLTLGTEPASQASATALVGIWEGTLTTVQAGKCSINGGPESSDGLRIVLRGDGGKIVGAAIPLTSPSVKAKDNLTVKIAGDTLRIELERTGLCGENFKRNYTAKLEGPLPSMVDGKRVLLLKGLDVPCIQTGCRFGLVLSAEWKGPPP